MYNMVVASFISLALNKLISDYYNKGSILDIELLKICF